MFIFEKNLKNLCKKVAKKLKKKINKIKIKKYKDGEYDIEINKSIKNKNILLFKNICKPVNKNLIECLFLIRYFKENLAKKITLITPFLGYSRQNKPKNKKNKLICSKLVAELLEKSGINKIITIDIHSKNILNFYKKVKILNIKTTKLIEKLVRKKKLKIVFPDKGSYLRFLNLKKYTGKIFIKKRKGKKVKVKEIKANKNINKRKKKLLIVDDILDTGKTVKEILKKIKGKKIKKIIYCTHLIGEKKITKKLKGIKKIYTTNSIERKKKKKDKKIEIIDISKIIAKSIKND